MNNLKAIRTAKGYKQTDVARALNISRQTYYNYETGKREADYETLLRLGEFFDVSVEELLRNDSEKEKAPHISARSFSPDGSIHIKIEPKTIEKWATDISKLSKENRDRLQDYLEILLKSQDQGGQAKK